ncbi:MAG: ABC transporter permease [Capsulimonadales bacterium]|nr:ABC transporter permease [Capsulimonadales bacterium]
MNLTLAKRLLPAASLLLLTIFFAVKSPTFLTVENAFTLANQYAYLLIIGIGATVVIVAGGIDLSVGSVLALSGIAAAQVMVQRGWPVWAGCLCGVGVGAAIGLLNGLIVTRLRVPAFIATLGTLLIARGLALRIAKGVTIDGTPDGFNLLASGRPFGLPAPLITIVLVAVLVAFLLNQTKFGRYVYAIGSNPEAARVSGIRTGQVTLLVYVLGGALAGLAGLIETARLGSGNPTGGSGYELDVVTAVVVGGASLQGGEGRVSGTILGALLIAVLHNGSNLLGVDPFDQNIYIGILIIGAVAFDQFLRRMR